MKAHFIVDVEGNSSKAHITADEATLPFYDILNAFTVCSLGVIRREKYRSCWLVAGRRSATPVWASPVVYEWQVVVVKLKTNTNINR